MPKVPVPSILLAQPGHLSNSAHDSFVGLVPFALFILGFPVTDPPEFRLLLDRDYFCLVLGPDCSIL